MAFYTTKATIDASDLIVIFRKKVDDLHNAQSTDQAIDRRSYVMLVNMYEDFIKTLGTV